MEKFKKFFILSVFFPLVAAAAITDVKSFIVKVTDDIKLFIPVLFTVMGAVFLYGIAKYSLSGGKADKDRAVAQKYIYYGLIGIAVVVSVWGIIAIMSGIFGIETGGTPPVPPGSGL